MMSLRGHAHLGGIGTCMQATKKKNLYTSSAGSQLRADQAPDPANTHIDPIDVTDLQSFA